MFYQSNIERRAVADQLVNGLLSARNQRELDDAFDHPRNQYIFSDLGDAVFRFVYITKMKELKKLNRWNTSSIHSQKFFCTKVA